MDPEDREAVVRRSLEAWSSENWEERLREVWNTDGVIVAPEGWPETGTFVGWQAMVAQWRRIKGSWTEDHVDLVSFEAVGEGAVAQVNWTIRGEASGAPMEVEAWLVCEFREGRLSKMTYCLDRAAARAAADSISA